MGTSYKIVHTESSLGWGGQERRIVAEALAMTQRGHQIFLGVDPRGQLYREAEGAGLRCVALDFRKSGTFRTILKLRRLLQREKVQILNTHSSWDSWVGMAACWGLRGTHLIRTRHLSTPLQKSWPTRFLYRRPVAIITTAQAISQLIQDATSVPAERITAIPTGLVLSEYAFRPPGPLPPPGPPPWPPDVFRIGVVAVLRSWKGHLYLLEALHRLKEAGEPMHAIIVGDGPYRQVIEAKVQELHLQGHVWLTGYQPGVTPWLAWMEVVVLPSYAHEGVPQALIQAMAMGKPVVGTDCGGIPEIVVPGCTGLLVPPRDSQALANALLMLQRKPDQRRALGEHGLDLVKVRHSQKNMAEAVDEVYRAVLAGKEHSE